MADHNDHLNERLKQAFRKRDDTADNLPTVKADVEIISQTEPPDAPDSISEEKMGLISRLKLRNAESAHELQKARLTYETELQLIQHRAEAATRESKAFWDAKSVEVAETIKTYVQSTIRALEIDRLDSRNADLQRAYESAATALEKAQTSALPEVMKDRLVQDIVANFEKTLARIQEDAIVSKYDLD